MNQVSLSIVCPHEAPQEETVLIVWSVGLPYVSTIMASRKTMRNHSGNKGFIQKFKDHISCVAWLHPA
jgi:hypothetical protein